jgi:ABC-type transporter MlaC component
MTMLIFRAVVVLTGLLAAGATARAQQVEPSIIRYVEEVEKSARAIQGDKSGQACRDFVTSALDVPSMSIAVAGAARQQMTPAQFVRFQGAFAKRLANDCIKRMESYRGEDLVIVGSRPSEDLRIVGVRTVQGDSGGPVTIWRLRQGGPRGWRAVDLVSDGRSLVGTVHEDYAAFLGAHNNDIEALLTWMGR